jgi:hypothetical protein
MEKKILSFEEFSKQYTEGTLDQDNNTEMDSDEMDMDTYRELAADPIMQQMAAEEVQQMQMDMQQRMAVNAG